jgi:hypothetical protein
VADTIPLLQTMRKAISSRSRDEKPERREILRFFVKATASETMSPGVADGSRADNRWMSPGYMHCLTCLVLEEDDEAERMMQVMRIVSL